MMEAATRVTQLRVGLHSARVYQAASSKAAQELRSPIPLVFQEYNKYITLRVTEVEYSCVV